jgi:hypothetical protein
MVRPAASVRVGGNWLRAMSGRLRKLLIFLVRSVGELKAKDDTIYVQRGNAHHAI